MIRMEHFTFRYEKGTENVLDQIDLEVEKGGFLGIIGPSGAGKTTLIRAVDGIIPHYYKGDYYGKVIVDEMDAFDTELTDLSRSVGTVFQDIDSQMVATVVEDEILYGLENYGVPHGEIEGRIREALELVGISNLRYRSIASLSGGQKQKVAIAAILALKPKALLLDEPTGELDPASSRQIFSLLKELNEKQGITIIVVEQKIMLLCEFARELGVLHKGKFLLRGSVRDVLAHSDELERIGVQCPRVVTLTNEAAKAQIPMGLCMNLEEADREIRRILQGKIPESRTEMTGADSESQPSQKAGAPAIAFRNVTFHYTSEDVGLSGMSFEIHPGDFVALIGENGAGKSTASKLMNGLLKPVSGSVKVFGMDTETTRTSQLAKKIGFLFQNPDRQICQSTVRGELLFSLQLVSEWSKSRQIEEAESMLERLGLDGDKDPFTLSRGERQRVALASVLVTKPEILVLDEPTTGLDYRECIQIMDEVRRLNQENGITVIMVCHDMELVLDYAKRVLVLAQGRIQLDAPTRQVFGNREVMELARVLPPQITALGQQLGGAFSQVSQVEEVISIIKEVQKTL